MEEGDVGLKIRLLGRNFESFLNHLGPLSLEAISQPREWKKNFTVTVIISRNL
jgi:hypothetical protein